MHAHSYVRAAGKVARGSTPFEQIDMRMPVNFLFGHACELAMKSLLITKGYDDNELRQVGHHLDKAIAACSAEGVMLDAEFVRYCEIMGKPHGGYLTRYAIQTFPWVGYEDALKMLEPQMRLLPWVWPSSPAQPQTAPARAEPPRAVVVEAADPNDYDLVPGNFILRGQLSDDGIDITATVQFRNRSTHFVALKPLRSVFEINGKAPDGQVSGGISTPIRAERTEALQFRKIRIFHKNDPSGRAEFDVMFGLSQETMRTILRMRYDFTIRSYPPNKSTDQVLEADVAPTISYAVVDRPE